MEKEWYVGCVGCIDFGVNMKSCDYLLNNGHCRPCKADRTGCELYQKTPRGMAFEDECRTWDPQEARRLIAEGLPLIKVARKIGASFNSLQVWVRDGARQQTKAACRKRKPKGIWDEAAYRKLYEEGLTDPEAAKRMGLDHMTVWKYRRRLGLPANGKKKRGCSAF